MPQVNYARSLLAQPFFKQGVDLCDGGGREGGDGGELG